MAITTENVLTNVKIVLDVNDNLQDPQLRLIINNIQSRLKIWFKRHTDLTEVPDELQFVIEEMAVTRYNRLGSEGAKSESVEGRSVTFTDDDFAPYEDILEDYTPEKENTGKVTFF